MPYFIVSLFLLCEPAYTCLVEVMETPLDFHAMHEPLNLILKMSCGQLNAR